MLKYGSNFHLSLQSLPPGVHGALMEHAQHLAEEEDRGGHGHVWEETHVWASCHNSETAIRKPAQNVSNK